MPAIQIKSPALTLKAGRRALARIRERGLQPADVGIVPGAAGGPKALGIQGLDLAIFGEWLPRAPRERSLIGASIGSWRFASACLPDAVAGLTRLGELYTRQRFPKGVSILAHDHKASLGLGLSSVIRDNLIGRRHLHRHFERVILHDARQAPPLAALTDFPSRYLHLDGGNLRQALLASGSIPMVMEGVRDLPGAGPGTYRDGGLLDYHLDLPYEDRGVVLYPHFTDKVIPGWFDKGLPWRRGDAGRLQDVLLLAPSREYLARLPHAKLPDRKDFTRYLGDDDGRERYWRQAMAESRRLGDEFLELVDGGRLGEHLQALD
ncbi:patatin-like phospholipase family protein [Pseudomonas aeruginosa]|uniref:patatin-like phospholipase family protein n=1 Tax=Pseudomonas aeruginosa TaxID=287 RepID=UPI00104E402A|nr:patatin-like phospholipase family protein [Pseudomonas aeruginosa]